MFKKYIILLASVFISQLSVLAQDSYPNLNFSQKTFEKWRLYRGPQQGLGGGRTVQYTDISTSGATIPGGYFQFIYPPTNPAAKQEDPNTCYNIRRVPIDKKYSVRVGPLSPGGYGNPQGYKAAYTMHVVPERTTLVYSFAFVQQFDHGSTGGNDPAGFGGSASGAGNNASMWLQTLDANGNQVAGVCGNYRLYPGAAKDVPWFDWNYCGEISNTPWITDVLDLRAFIGQDITIEFNTMDCYTGHHMAYAYVSPETFASDTSTYYCPGDSVYISAPRGFKTYEWKEMGGTFTDIKQNSAKIGKDLPHVHKLGIANPRDGAKYECTFTSYSGCSAKIVYELIADSVHAVFSGDFGTDACRKQIFTDNSTVKYPDHSGLLKWQWTFADPLTGVNNISTAQSPFHVFSDTGTYQVKLLTTSKTGCKDSLIKPIHVVAQGLPDFTFANSCLSDSIHFINTSQTVTGTFIGREWKFGNHNTSVANSPVHKYTAQGTYQVTLKTVTSEGCIDSLTKRVTIYPLPQTKFELKDACKGIAIVPEDKSVISSGSITNWKWYFGDNSPVTSTQQSNHSYRVSGSYTVSLLATSDKGCKDSLQKTVLIHEIPVADFTLDTNKGCTPVCVNFTSRSSIVNGTIDSYQWLLNSEQLGTSDDLQSCFEKVGTHTMVLEVTSGGCKNTASKNVEVYALPEADFSANPQPATILDPEIHFTNLSKGATTYQWTFGDETYGRFEDQIHTYSRSGLYHVELLAISAYGCEAKITRDVVIDSVYSVHIPNAFSPNGDNIHDLFEIGNIRFFPGAVLEVYNQWGEPVFKSNAGYTIPWDGTKSGQPLPVSTYYYVLHLNNEDQKQLIGYITLLK